MVLLSGIDLLANLTALLSYSFTAVALRSSRIQPRVLYGPGVLRESYDYVIVGGGTAGLTIGDRLSEDGSSKPIHNEPRTMSQHT